VGAFASNSNDNDTVYISRPRPSIAVQSSPWGARTGAVQNAAATEIGSVITGGYNVLSSTVSVADSAFQLPWRLPGVLGGGKHHYYWQVASEGRPDFSVWSSSVERASPRCGGFGDRSLRPPEGPGAALYENGTVTHLGYFSITSAGVVSFTRSGTDPFLTDTDATDRVMG
jgi:hypothetical protein